MQSTRHFAFGRGAYRSGILRLHAVAVITLLTNGAVPVWSALITNGTAATTVAPPTLAALGIRSTCDTLTAAAHLTVCARNLGTCFGFGNAGTGPTHFSGRALGIVTAFTYSTHLFLAKWACRFLLGTSRKNSRSHHKDGHWGNSNQNTAYTLHQNTSYGENDPSGWKRINIFLELQGFKTIIPIGSTN